MHTDVMHTSISHKNSSAAVYRNARFFSKHKINTNPPTPTHQPPTDSICYITEIEKNYLKNKQHFKSL